MTQKIVLLLVILLTATLVEAQMTIGSLVAPNKGALLDLKELTDANGDPLTGNTTATKGLSLPRVNLTAISDITVDIAGVDNSNKDGHIGLMVYNVNNCLKGVGNDAAGLYVWDGNEWQQLDENQPAPEVSYYNDNREQLLGKQSYPYRTFGNAGTWMSENMRYVPNDGGATMTENHGTLGIGNAREKYYAYPNTLVGGTVPDSWTPRQGLLYTYHAAALGENLSDDGQGSASESTPTVVQGICPLGWHIPSDREWNVLEKEIYENAIKYSNYTASELSTTSIWNPISAIGKWNAAWETGSATVGSNGTGGHAAAMKSPCTVKNSPSSIITNGRSLSALQGGFDALVVGGYYGANPTYGLIAFFWTSSSYPSSAAASRVRYLSDQNSPAKVWHNFSSRYARYSIRCKKDN